MKFTVHDTFSAMADLLERPLEERPALLTAMLAPMRASIPMPGDSVDLHHMGSGFRVDREDERYLPAVRNLIDRDVRGRIERALADAADRLRSFDGPDHLNVMFVLGDPDDDYLMDVAGGYYGMGSYGDWLYVIAWPREDVIDRIAHCAVHEFHHNVRFRNVEWNPETVTVGEHVVAEGLAEAFVREMSGPGAMDCPPATQFFPPSTHPTRRTQAPPTAFPAASPRAQRIRSTSPGSKKTTDIYKTIMLREPPRMPEPQEYTGQGDT
ncbi:DUF2268 domain-containing putative Zn-dependent protease [Nonomuraea roseola]|uniref:DUF2268 domain-containing putative Zn-dependent protease n=1 Tax=Nonomuraea roseola TaxID=46179 RepID=UPI0031F83E65